MRAFVFDAQMDGADVAREVIAGHKLGAATRAPEARPVPAVDAVVDRSGRRVVVDEKGIEAAGTNCRRRIGVGGSFVGDVAELKMAKEVDLIAELIRRLVDAERILGDEKRIGGNGSLLKHAS